MKEQLRMMEEFHQAFGHPVNRPDIIMDCIEDEVSEALEFVKLRIKLHEEECSELTEELWSSFGEGKTTTNLLKEGADLLYVLLGTFVSLGLGEQLIEAFKRVHESNMSKLGEDGKPIYRDDGKVLKGPNYKPPVLDDLV
jgi:NTP pyrophosphatase (non-canonical NTP hydrolase)